MNLLLVLEACLLTCVGQIAQKYAVESWRDIELTWIKKLRSPWMWLTLFALGSGLLIWLLVLQRMEVGIAYPMLSINLVLITLISHVVFDEPIDRQHWLGVMLVISGVSLLGHQS